MNDHPRLTESLKSDVYELCCPEGRMVGTDGHVTAERFVARRLEEIGLLPLDTVASKLLSTGL